MLNERDSRVLATAIDVLLYDLDPDAARQYLLLFGVITESDSDVIKKKPTQLSRLNQLLRTYRRRAFDLKPLFGFFDYNKQPHLAEHLKRTEVTCADSLAGPDVVSGFSREKRLRILLAGQVPAYRDQVQRTAEIDSVTEALRDHHQSDGFFVVLHGMPGSGKTALVSTVLTESNLIGGCFNSVAFLRESASQDDQVKNLFADLYIMLLDDAERIVTPINLAETSKVALNKLIQDVLLDRPNLLIVLDDVRREETVRWADGLGLRILATTRNSDLFNAANGPVEVIPIGGLTKGESVEMIKRNGCKKQVASRAPTEYLSSLLGFTPSEPQRSADDIMEDAYKASSGLPAILAKMCKLADGRLDRLAHYANALNERGPSVVTCVSSYEHRNFHDAMLQQVQQLSEQEQASLASATVMPPEEWIPNEAWAHVVPVDVCGHSDGTHETHAQLSQISKNGAWLIEANDGNSFKLSNIVSSFLRVAVDKDIIKSITNTLKLNLVDILRAASPGTGDAPPFSRVRDFFTRNYNWFNAHNVL